jgi:hypothetical protein
MVSTAGVEMDESAWSFANYLVLRFVRMIFTHFNAAAVKGHNSSCIATPFNKIISWARIDRHFTIKWKFVCVL